jgi:hypothetical protein
VIRKNKAAKVFAQKSERRNERANAPSGIDEFETASIHRKEIAFG